MFKYLFKKHMFFILSKSNYSSYRKLSKIGPIKHYAPATRVWNNSVYNFNKNNEDNSFAKYNRLSKIINSYFNLHNNINLARSKRMRYLRIKSKSKRLYVSKPEIKQTNDKIIITVYYFDKLKHNFTRKNFFYNRPDMVKHILNKKYRKRKLRRKKLLRKTKFLERRIKYLGIRHIKELKSFKDKNKFKNKYIEQSLLFHFFKYLFSLINIQMYNPINLNKKLIKNNRLRKSIIKKESIKINNIINANPKILFWINFNKYSFEKIDNANINYAYLMTKVINEYNHFLKNKDKNKNTLIKLNFIAQINKKLLTILNVYSIKNIISEFIIFKIYNFLSLKVYMNFAKKIFNTKYNKISKMTYLSMSNIIKFKHLLPALKMVIDTFYNKKTELNMVNLKYYYLNSDIFTQALITKLKKKVSPTKILKRSLGRIKVFISHNIRKKRLLNNMDKLSYNTSLSLDTISNNAFQTDMQYKSDKKDWLQIIFNKLYPYNLIHKFNKLRYFSKKKMRRNKKTTNILNDIKYKVILGMRIEAKGRLTRRHKAARSITYLKYKGNLRDNEFYYDKEENYNNSISTVLLRNDTRTNTQHTYKSSKRRIGSFGVKTWISGK